MNTWRRFCAVVAAGMLLAVAPGCVSSKRQNQSKAQSDLGTAYLREANSPAAVAALERATDLDPRNWDAWNKLGLAYSASGASDKAEVAFERALKLVPGQAEILNNYGLFLMSQQRVDEAIVTFETARSDLTYRQPALILTNLGYALYLQGELATAQARLDDAIRRAPLYCPAHFNKGLVRKAQGAPDAALVSFEQVIGLCGASVPGAYHQAAMILLAQGETAAGCAYLADAISASPATDLAVAARNRQIQDCP